LLTYLDVVRGALTFRDAKYYLFFTATANGRSEARAFLKAIHGWGVQPPTDLSRIQPAVLVANGAHDRMVPSHNSADLARRLPNAQLKLDPDAGHGGIFQYHAQFVPEALNFLAA
jgi:pimeloyl-ACP methyl ester carboxylesterase